MTITFPNEAYAVTCTLESIFIVEVTIQKQNIIESRLLRYCSHFR